MYCPLPLIGAEVKVRDLSDLISHPRPWQTQTILGHRSVHGKITKDWERTDTSIQALTSHKDWSLALNPGPIPKESPCGPQCKSLPRGAGLSEVGASLTHFGAHCRAGAGMRAMGKY